MALMGSNIERKIRGLGLNPSNIERNYQEVLKREGIEPKRLGLVTYKRIEDRLADELGVATYRDETTGEVHPLSLHFGGLRGSNLLEECDVLVVVGTPMPALEDIMRYAQVIFYEDGEPVLTIKMSGSSLLPTTS